MSNFFIQMETYELDPITSKQVLQRTQMTHAGRFELCVNGHSTVNLRKNGKMRSFSSINRASNFIRRNSALMPSNDDNKMVFVAANDFPRILRVI